MPASQTVVKANSFGGMSSCRAIASTTGVSRTAQVSSDRTMVSAVASTHDQQPQPPGLAAGEVGRLPRCDVEHLGGVRQPGDDRHSDQKHQNGCDALDHIHCVGAAQQTGDERNNAADRTQPPHGIADLRESDWCVEYAGRVTTPEQHAASRPASMARAVPLTSRPGYPAEYEADVVLRDGATAHLRPITPEDADLLVEFYARVSEQSKYYRFFAPYPQLSDRDVAQVHPGRLPRPAGADRHRRRRDDRGRALRADRSADRRGRVPDRGRAPGPRAWGNCSWSTWRRRPARTGSPGSSPRCCRTTAR